MHSFLCVLFFKAVLCFVRLVLFYFYRRGKKIQEKKKEKNKKKKKRLLHEGFLSLFQES